MSISTLAEFLTEQPRPEFGIGQSKEPCVYYLCSLDNYHKIIKSGHILPKNRIHYSDTLGDLSSSTIQARRDDDIDVGDGEVVHPTPGHNCLNFFLNPNNSTYQAIARNSMAANSGDNQVLVLEISLGALADYLADITHLFGCSARNIARGAAVTSIKDEYARFSWNDIMVPKGANKPQASEFLLWISEKAKTTPETPSAGLPTKLINKVYCDGKLFETLDDESRFDVSVYTHTWSKGFLFSHAKALNSFLQPPHPPYSEICDALTKLESEMPFPLSVNAFSDSTLGIHYQHGYLHVAKVMFWVAYLTHPDIINTVLPKEVQCEHLTVDCMLAALIHDLARTSNQEDEKHGKEAIRKYVDELTKHTGGDLPRVTRIRQAVVDHCKPDASAKDKNNPVWKILKDADALDRGRFADPCDATDFKGSGCQLTGCRHTGCSHKTLRLNYEQLGGSWAISVAARELAWTVYSAPSSPTEPVKSLISYVGASIKIAS